MITRPPRGLGAMMPAGRGWRQPAVVAVLVGLALGVWAVLLNIWLNLSSFAEGPWWERVGRATEVNAFVVSVGVVWILLLGLLALTNRFALTLGISVLVVGALATINATKIDLRGDPLQPADWVFLQQPGFLVQMVGVGPVVVAVAAGALVLVLFVLLGRWAARLLPPLRGRVGRKGRRTLLGARVVALLVTALMLLAAAHFHQPHNRLRSAYEANGATWMLWKQRSNFMSNGFVAGVLFNLGVDVMQRPEGYSAGAMRMIADRYAARARGLNLGRTGTLADVNVVLVLSESFSQPRWLTSVEWPTDPIPNTTALMRSTLSGRMLSPGYGSRTANVEFEVLTGQSMSLFSPQVQVAYDQVVPKRPGYPSFVRELVDGGHRALSIHPFNYAMYRRTDVLRDFGFSRLVDQSAMTSRSRLGHSRFISDKSAYGEVVDRLRASTEPAVVHLITMQNHMPYDRHAYDDPIVPEAGLPAESAARAGQYARGINLSDAALPGFLAGLRGLGEKTLVLFYGDHLPGQVYPLSLEESEGERTIHETPWFAWSSWKRLAPRSLPTMSPNQLLTLLVDAADVPLTPYQALLTRVREELPAMDAGLLVGSDDRVVAEAQLTDRQRALLHDYRLVQYDFSVGRRHAVRAMMQAPPPPQPSSTSDTSAAVKP